MLRHLMHLMLPKKHEPPSKFGQPPQRTIGIDVKTCDLRGMTISIREVGGVMQPLWPNFVSDSRTLVYVVDDASSDENWTLAAEG